MTKNTTGGKKQKSFARKHSSASQLTLSASPLEVYAIVTKIYGNGLFQCTTHNSLELVGHIRNKFKGRYKHSNLVSVGSIILLGLRDWESIPKNGDLMNVYESDEIPYVNSHHNIQNLIQMANGMAHFQSSSSSAPNGDDILFTTHDTETDYTVSESSGTSSAAVIMNDKETINIDDI